MLVSALIVISRRFCRRKRQQARFCAAWAGKDLQDILILPGKAELALAVRDFVMAELAALLRIRWAHEQPNFVQYCHHL